MAAMVSRFSSPSASGGGTGGIDPQASFLDYKVWLEIRQTDNTAVLQPLPIQPVGYAPVLKNAWNATGYTQPYNPATAPTAIMQTRGAPLYVMILSGYTVRAAYDISPPQLVSIFGQQPVPFNDQTNLFPLRRGRQLGRADRGGIVELPLCAAEPTRPNRGAAQSDAGSTQAGLAETGLGGFVTSQG